MGQSVSLGSFSEVRKEFYTQFLEFARHYPEIKVSLYVPRDDLYLLSEEGWLSVVCDLLDLCECDRLTLIGAIPRPHLLAYLQEIKKGWGNPEAFR